MQSGIVIIDKPRGPSSAEVSSFVKKILNAEKTGHLGTLDPKVSGVLPILVGKACKLAPWLRLDKEYIGIIRFHKPISEQKVLALFKDYTGEISQKPPKRSAVAKKLRKRIVHELELLEMDGQFVLFRARVEAGVYIRTLAHNIGKQAGPGANLIELRRTCTGKATEKDALTLQDLSDAVWLNDFKILKPNNWLFQEMPRVQIKESAVESIKHGSPLAKSGILEAEPFEQDNYVQLICNNELIAIGKSSKELRNGFIIKPVRVI